MNFATKRRTRNRSYLFSVFVAERKILFAIAVNSCCEFDVIWAFSYDRRHDAFDFSDRVLRSRSDEKRSRMNLLLYENRNVRFEKSFASVVRLNADSRAYCRFVDAVKTICEEFLQWFVASIAKHVECVCRERLVEFAFWLRHLQNRKTTVRSRPRRSPRQLTISRLSLDSSCLDYSITTKVISDNQSSSTRDSFSW
jgi:ribosomal protein L32